MVEEYGEVVPFASASSYHTRERYAGIVEFSIYAAPRLRTRSRSYSNGSAFGGSREGGLWKSVFRLFTGNEASRKLLRSLGLREVGIYGKHARLDRVWKHVVIVERFIPRTALDR